MKILILALAICFLFTSDISACSCSSKIFAPSCEWVSKADAVFVGEPVEYSGGVYSFKIENAYKGIKDGSKEVKVYGAAGTSCEIKYGIGTKYIIFAEKSSREPNILTTGLCSGSRIATQSEIDYLDKFSKGETETVVFGQVLQWVPRYGFFQNEESNPVAEASLMLENKTEKYTAASDLDGNFIFKGIKDGKYKLSARKSPFRPMPDSYDISVIKGGCQLEFVQLNAQAAIEGTLLFQDGKPAANKRLELLRKKRDGKWYSASYMWKQTDKDGKFKFTELESGEYLLGYEIWSDRPSYSSPYPTHYFPNTSERNNAQIITLSPNQTRSGLVLKLPGQQTGRSIKIKVVYEDGSFPGNNLLQISNYGNLIYSSVFRSVENGVYTFNGFKEREYEFSARYWIDDLSAEGETGNKRLALSESVKVSAGEDAEITLTLSKKLLYKDLNY